MPPALCGAAVVEEASNVGGRRRVRGPHHRCQGPEAVRAAMGPSFCSCASTPRAHRRMQYGLQAMFSTIERLHHSVTSAGNPIQMDLKTRYVVKGIGKEQTIDSKIMIHYDETSGRVTKVQDKWDGNLPQSSFANVSHLSQLVSPWWWLHYAEGWGFWLWSFSWNTLPWQVRGCCIRLRP